MGREVILPDKRSDLQRTSDYVPQSESAALMQALTKSASDPNFNAQNLSLMLEAMRQIRKDEAEAEFNRELAVIQNNLPRIGKDGHVKYNAVSFDFATYENIDKAIRPLLAAHGFSISFDMEPGEKGDIYIGTLAHRLGHSKSSRLRLPADTSGGKNAIQAVGSTDSYARRYLVTRLLNIVTEGQDNDGNSVGFIDERECNKLIDLAAACDEFMPPGQQDTLNKLLAHLKIKALSDLQKKRYPDVCNMLMDKRRKLQEANK